MSENQFMHFGDFDWFLLMFFIGHFGKYHNTLCLSPQILHKHCFQFFMGLTMVPRENKNNAYAKFGGTNKEYYGIFRSGLWRTDAQITSSLETFSLFFFFFFYK